MFSMRFKVLLSCIMTVLCSLFTGISHASEEGSVFGPVTILRAVGKPAEATFTFPKLPGFEEPFRLEVLNGSEDGSARVSSAYILINGIPVLSPSDFNQKVREISREVELTETNSIIILLRSKPGSFVKIRIVGQEIEQQEQIIDQSSVEVGAGGGSGLLQDFAVVTLGEAPMRPTLLLKLEKVISSAKSALYEGETMGAGPSMSELLRITSSENVTEPIAVAVQIPPAFVGQVPSGYQVELFAEFSQIGADGEIISNFERLGAIFDPVRSIAYANLPPYAFSPSNSVTTNIVVGSYPDAPTSQVTGTSIVPSQAIDANPNDVISLSANLTFSIPPEIGNPLFTAPIVTSGFGPRTHPITGQPGFHPAADLDTASQPVVPILPGTVVASGPQGGCTLVNGVCMTGFGHRVRIDHGGGLSSVYAHLEPDGLPAVGTAVSTTNVIGTSDTTGTATGDHLHLEYRINGNPVDPMLFINQQDAEGYLDELSVVALVNGQAVESTRQAVTNAQINGNAASFVYNDQVDLVPLQLAAGSANQLSIVMQNGTGISVPIISVPLTINALALRVILQWDTYDTDVDLHVRDSLGRESWYANLCGIPNGCLDRDDVDGFGPEVFDLTALEPGVSYTVFLHYFSDHGNGPTTARVVVEQGTQTFGPFVQTLSNGEYYTIGVFPQ